MNRKLQLPSRVRTALLGAPLVAFIVWRGETLFLVFVLMLAVLALRELAVAARGQGTPLIVAVAYPMLLMLVILPWLFFHRNQTMADDLLGFALWGAVLWLMPICLLAWAVMRYPARRSVSLASVALTLLATAYAGLFAFLPSLRELPGIGLALMWLTLLGVWAGDIAAYYAGRRWGRVKLTPLSPGKTREGAMGGWVATVAVSTFVAWLMRFEITHGLVLGAIIGVVAPLGDLVESFWKRELDVKDLGTLLPGHGGVLDRCDSLLFAAFVVYFYALWQLV